MEIIEYNDKYLDDIKDLLVAFNDSRGYSASEYNWHSEEV